MYICICNLKISFQNPKCLNLEAVVLRCLLKIGVLKNLANFAGKQMCWTLFLIKLQA